MHTTGVEKTHPEEKGDEDVEDFVLVTTGCERYFVNADGIDRPEGSAWLA